MYNVIGTNDDNDWLEVEYYKPPEPYNYMQEVNIKSDKFTGVGYYIRQYDAGHVIPHYLIECKCRYERINENGEKELSHYKIQSFEPRQVEEIK